MAFKKESLERNLKYIRAIIKRKNII